MESSVEEEGDIENVGGTYNIQRNGHFDQVMNSGNMKWDQEVQIDSQKNSKNKGRVFALSFE